MRDTNDQQLLTRYLLEDLSEEELEGLEEGYLTDDDLYMKLMVAEDEIIAAYIQGELSRSDRAKFEKAFLTNPHRLRKVESTREILNFFAEKPVESASRSGFPALLFQRQWSGIKPVYVMAGLLLFLALPCALSVWLLVERHRMLNALEAAREQLRRAESEHQLRMSVQTPTPTPADARDVPLPTPTVSTPERAQGTGNERGMQRQRHEEQQGPNRSDIVESPSSSVLAFTLPRPGIGTRGGGGNTAKPLVIPRGIVLVRLTAKVIPNEYPAYRVSLQKLGGPEVLSQVVTKGERGTSDEQVSVEVPASFLVKGDYILKIVGDAEILALHQVTFDKRDAPRK